MSGHASLGSIQQQNERRRALEARARLTAVEAVELERLKNARYHRLRRIGAQITATRAKLARLEQMAIDA